jgi:hypothetical protein
MGDNGNHGSSPQNRAMQGHDIVVVGASAGGLEEALMSFLAHSLPEPPSGLVCPECGGALWELREGKLNRYRCHVGHGYTADGLVARQEEWLVTALWTALRTLEENAALQRRMANNTKERGLVAVSAKYISRARDIELRAELIRSILVDGEPNRALEGTIATEQGRARTPRKRSKRKTN